MSRKVFLLGLGLSLIALAFALTQYVLDLQPGVTEANIKRIREGMTVQQVEAILGAPRRFQTDPAIGWWWEGETGTAVVVFDENERVHIIASFHPYRRARPGFRQRSTTAASPAPPRNRPSQPSAMRCRCCSPPSRPARGATSSSATS